MKLRNETAEIQELLGNYCKTGVEVEIPGITEGRVHHYRRLVYNVVKNTMNQAFPISVASMDDDEWDKLVHEFFSKHPSTSTQIWKLPYEFYQYHLSKGTANRLKKPYLNDLLYFEWAEIEIHTMPDKNIDSYTASGNPLSDILVLNLEYEIIQLEYPVHTHAVKGIELQKGSYFVLLYREQGTGHVKFLELSVLHAFILTRIFETGESIQSFKGEIAQLAQVESEKYLNDYLIGFVNNLIDRQMILGYRKYPA